MQARDPSNHPSPKTSEPADSGDWTALKRVVVPLRSQVADKLRTAIMEGVLKPGERLVERSLCEKLGVSRSLFREAVRQLEAERLLVTVPNKGPVVHRLSSAEAGELYDMSAVVEGLCARYFARRGSAAEIAQLEQRLQAFEKALLRGDPARIRRTKYAYYEALLAGCHSEPVQSILRQLEARLSQVWSSSLRRPGRVEKGIEEFRRVVNAIKARDEDAAFEASCILSQHASEVARGVIEEDLGTGSSKPRAAAKTRTRRKGA